MFEYLENESFLIKREQSQICLSYAKRLRVGELARECLRKVSELK